MVPAAARPDLVEAEAAARAVLDGRATVTTETPTGRSNRMTPALTPTAADRGGQGHLTYPRQHGRSAVQDGGLAPSSEADRDALARRFRAFRVCALLSPRHQIRSKEARRRPTTSLAGSELRLLTCTEARCGQAAGAAGAGPRAM
jgi:hypothetical protein